jgi:hypothetical protein
LFLSVILVCPWISVEKIILTNFLYPWVSDLVKFPEKGLSTMAAIWPSTERVKSALIVHIHNCSDISVLSYCHFSHLIFSFAELDDRLDARVDSMIQRGLLKELLDFHEAYNRPRVDDDKLVFVFIFRVIRKKIVPVLFHRGNN